MGKPGLTRSQRQKRPFQRMVPARARALRKQSQSITIPCRGGFMANLKGLASIVSALRVERTNLASQLKRVDAALFLLGKSHAGNSYTKPRRTLSASARRRISLAQKARWAKRSANDQAGKMKPKRIMSASARRKIAAAQRARWAKVRAKKVA